MSAPTPRHQVSIIACARWETACITEWLLYHRAIGFDHVYLYCNDDDPAELYREVLPFVEGSTPFVTFVHYPFQGQQYQMYAHCLRGHKDASTWVMFLDIDEFLCIRGSNDIKAFLRDVPDGWDSISFNWLMFGNSGHKTRPNGSVLLNYTLREDSLKHVCKTLTRTAAIDLRRLQHRTYIWHHWDESTFGEMRAFNVVGDPMRAVRGDDEGRAYVASGDNAQRVMARAVVHHYAFKSEADYLMRAERGSGGEFIDQGRYRRVHDEGTAADSLRPWNAVVDTTLADFWRNHLDRAQSTRVIPLSPWPNLSRGRPADQSSVSEWSTGKTTQEDAGNAVNGRFTGGPQFHTSLEPFPWWSVDLGTPARIHEVRIYNRVDSMGCAERLRNFFVEASLDGETWSMIHAEHAGVFVGGVDGRPLLVRFDPPETARYVKITLVDTGFLHLDQVEIYGESDDDPSLRAPAAAVGGEAGAGVLAAPFPEALPPQSAAGCVVHVNMRGRLANRMLQFMAAHALASRVPGARLSGIDLPEWGIVHPVLPDTATRTLRVGPLTMRIELADLAARLRSGEAERVDLDTYAQHMHNFLPKQAYEAIFPPLAEADGFGPEYLVINIRGGEILRAPHPDYTLIPAEFYREVVDRTGLAPVFMGQIGANPYVERLRRLFPNAPFLPSRGVMQDFETIRRSRNIVVSVSTFSWLAAWLSDADQIIVPMSGFYNPAQYPEIDLLPLDDPRYRFYLFPLNYAVPVEEVEAAHAGLVGSWRYMRPEMIEELRRRRPRFGDPAKLLHEAFEEQFYLERYEGVREAVSRGAFRSGFEHYVMFGYFERRDPFPLDKTWYWRTYPVAAIEVGQGDFADFHHHYVAIGRERGYLACPPARNTATGWEERLRLASVTD